MKHNIFSTVLLFVLLLLFSCKSNNHLLKKNDIQKITVVKSDFTHTCKFKNSSSYILAQYARGEINYYGYTPWKTTGRGWSLANTNKYEPQGSNTMDKGGVFETTFIQKIKIVNTDDTKLLNNHSIRYYNPKGCRWDLMTEFEGTVCSLSGNNKIKEKPIVKSNIEKVRLNDTHSELRLKNIDLQKNDIILLKYTIQSPWYQHDLPTFEFQKKVPVCYSQYDLYTFRYPSYDIIKQGEGFIKIEMKNNITLYSTYYTHYQSSSLFYSQSANKIKRKGVRITFKTINVPPKAQKTEIPLGVKFKYIPLSTNQFIGFE